MTFNLDANGILNVNAKEESTGKSKNIKIKNEKGRLGKTEIEKMIAEAESYKEDDEQQRKRVIARNALESYLFSTRTALKEQENNLDSSDRVPVERIVDDHIEWLDYNREKDVAVYEEKLKFLQRLVTPLMAKVHKKSVPADEDEEGPTIEEVNE